MQRHILSSDDAASVEADYNAIRTAVGMTEDLGWGVLRITGDGARDLLDRALTGDVMTMMENVMISTLALTENGDFIADPLVMAGFEDFTLLCRPGLMDGLRAALDAVVADVDECELEDITDRTAQIRIDGPEAAELPRTILGGAVSGMRIMTFAETEFDGGPITVGRIGTTAEFGFFFLGEEAPIAALKQEILTTEPRTKMCGARVHNLLELETRSFNSAMDMPQQEHPLEAGCHWMFDFRKPDFVGADAVRDMMEEGLGKRMVCLRLDGEVSCAPSLEGRVLRSDREEDVGYIANAAWSPTLKTGIALAYLNADFAVVGLPVLVETPTGNLPGRTVSAPFLISRSNAPA